MKLVISVHCLFILFIWAPVVRGHPLAVHDDENPITTRRHLTSDPMRPIQSTSAVCVDHGPCSHLADLCCPTAEGVDLYCCMESDNIENMYRTEDEFQRMVWGGAKASYWKSNGELRGRGCFYRCGLSGPAPNDFLYNRNPTEQYDFIYYKTEAITDANVYVTEQKKFFIRIKETTAPPCTPILLQLDDDKTAGAEDYPKGRHSRYIGFTTGFGEQTIELDFLNRPDPDVPDSAITTIALFFGPGEYKDDQYIFHSFFDAVRCSKGDDLTSCSISPTPRAACPAIFTGESGESACSDGIDNDNDGMTDCEDPGCSGEPNCVITMRTSMLALDENYFALEDETTSSGYGRRTADSRGGVWNWVAWLMVILLGMVC